MPRPRCSLTGPRLSLVLTVSLLGIWPISAVGAIIYVDDDAANDPGPGDPAVSDPDEDGSAEHPFDAIQEALDASSEGDEIVVADGTYTGAGNGDLDFGGKAVTLRSANGPDACIINGSVDSPYAVRGFYFHSGETETSVLDGFTIYHCGAWESSPGGSAGGGILCSHSSPTIRNCAITWNSAAGQDCAGGGICCLDGANPTISDCTISNNGVGARPGGGQGGYAYGGGIACCDSSPTISDCTIDQNRAKLDDYTYDGVGHVFGGGIACQDSNPVIADCVITANETGPYYDHGCYGHGAGLYCYHSAPTLTDCLISANFSSRDDSTLGGGVYCEYDGNPTLVNCTISGNYLDCTGYGAGGGVYCTASSPTFITCTIVDNETCPGDNHGGGMACEFDGNAVIVNSIITGNSTPAAGGGVYCYLSSPTIINSTVADNETSSWQTGMGGGICCETADPIIAGCTINGNFSRVVGGGIYAGYDSQPVINNCFIFANDCRRGGGIYCEWYSSPLIENSTITGNVADTNYSVGGGIGCHVESSPTIRDCLIAENAARYGAGVYAHYYSSPTITNCTLARNTTDGHSSALHISYGGHPRLENSVLWNNDAQSSLDAFGYYPVELTVAYSDVQGGQAGVFNEGCTLIWGDGNIDADPLFADSESGDYHLTADSPCLDAGDPEFAPQPLETDIDGQARIWDGDDDENPVVDMGADEFGSFPYGDLNCDGIANAYDIDRLICAVSPNCDYEGLYPDCERRLADCNGDGLVNAYDIDSFIDLLAGN